MTVYNEWLSLIEVSGPFLAEPVLEDSFPQGLDGIESEKSRLFRQAYNEWREAVDTNDPLIDELHSEWISWVLRHGLEWDEDGLAEHLVSGINLAPELTVEIPEYGVTIKPDFALFTDSQSSPQILVISYAPDVALDKPLAADSWSATSAERIAYLCRATGCRLGLLTNGEQWMLVNSAESSVTTYSSWYARLWSQEPITLKAFFSLLNIRAFFAGFGRNGDKLPVLFDKSLEHQSSITETLGSQVQRAVEVLIQSIDRINSDRNGELLEGVEPAELYEAGLTLMMRLVFILCAEERELLLMGDETYESNYAVSTLRLKLREEAGLHGEEILSFRYDAWSRLLATFRLIYAGSEHTAISLPALGGSLFDPNRFPLLEGRSKGTDWRVDESVPLAIDNRTVLLFLEAIQIFRGRVLSYRALDVEQIGYVYEGLLEKTVTRAREVSIELAATKDAKKPWISLTELESAASSNVDVVSLLAERTGSSNSKILNSMSQAIDAETSELLLHACGNDQVLRDKLTPYVQLIRRDEWGNPLVYREGSFIVASGHDRRDSGAYYTPKSVAEAVTKEAIDPVIYDGMRQGQPKEDWKLKAPDELLKLKVCDPAMGSGAFLVQACRYLAERLCESWSNAEQDGYQIAIDGLPRTAEVSVERLPKDQEERLVIAKRLVSERCLYGVDINPLAVELAKLSLWLVTLAKGRPFGFLDHKLRAGDSLLGLTNLRQLTELSMDVVEISQTKLFGQEMASAVEFAIEQKQKIDAIQVLDIRDIEGIKALATEANEKLALGKTIADALVGQILATQRSKSDWNRIQMTLSALADDAVNGSQAALQQLNQYAQSGLTKDLSDSDQVRRPIHWFLEFPEIFISEAPGFDAIIGNPPFLGGQRITGAFGPCYRGYLVNHIASGQKGSADLVAYFFLRANDLLRKTGVFGLIAVNTISEGDTKDVGLDQIVSSGSTIIKAWPSISWAGGANVITSTVFVTKGIWCGDILLSDTKVDFIGSALTNRESWIPKRLSVNLNLAFQGVITRGSGFLLDDRTYSSWAANNDPSLSVVHDYLIGREVNQSPTHQSQRKIICFFDKTEREAQMYAEAYAYLEQNAKPERTRRKPNGQYELPKRLVENWWNFESNRPNLFHAIGRGKEFKKHPNDWESISKLEEVMVFVTQATKYPCFTFVKNDYIYANSLCVIASDSMSLFACLSTDIHAIWAWETGSRMKNDLRYSHGDIFETFPFPATVLGAGDSDLETLGGEFFEARSMYMRTFEVGMTGFYNQLHLPSDTSSDIVRMRELQTKLNSRVLTLYGFNDIELEMGFHEVGYLPEGKNLRYTVSEKARIELIGRLTSLNKALYQAEPTKSGSGSKGSQRSRSAVSSQPERKTQQEGIQSALDFQSPPPQVEIQNTKISKGNSWGSSAIDQILAWLEAHDGWFTREAVLKGSGADPSMWESAIEELLKDGDIQKRVVDSSLRYKATE